MIRHAVAEAQRRRSIEQTILQPTPTGHRLYERMDFRAVSSVAVYAS